MSVHEVVHFLNNKVFKKSEKSIADISCSPENFAKAEIAKIRSHDCDNFIFATGNIVKLR